MPKIGETLVVKGVQFTYDEDRSFIYYETTQGDDLYHLLRHRDANWWVITVRQRGNCMIYDFAAAFPQVAETALQDMKATYARILPGNRLLSNGELYIHSEPCDYLGRIGWEIRLSDDFAAELISYRAELESKLSWARKQALTTIRANERLDWCVEYCDPDSGWYGLQIDTDYETGSDKFRIGEVPKTDLELLKKRC